MEEAMSSQVQNPLPRWRGFNLLDFFTCQSSGEISEDDFRWIAGWGFDFVRLPMCYTLWIEDDDPYKLHEPMLARIDRAVDLGQKYGIHVNLNFHRAAGYSVNPERTEPYNLWKDQAALDAFCFHWQLFARRYKGIASSKLSFNLVNEPTNPSPLMSRQDHDRVMRATVAKIREIDPDRLIILDGLTWANDPLADLADLNVAQSCRAYLPMGVSHYMAPWVNGETFPPPVWPGGWNQGVSWTRKTLEGHYGNWAKLVAKGIGVHCGEGGAFNRTPHEVVLGWLRDVLAVLASLNIGYALWNFRGSFGILDSGRQDAVYDDWHGHRLDRRLLELLREF
jgi:endoglucanase